METSFSRRVPSKLPPDELWKNLAAAVQDSVGHPFWPTDLEESHSARLKSRGLIHVQYKGWLASLPVTYRITALDKEHRRLSYQSTADHPLQGGATVRVVKGANGGSELHWTGAYRYPWYSPAGLLLPRFLRRFFRRLRRNLRAYEAEHLYRQRYANVHDLTERRRKAAGR